MYFIKDFIMICHTHSLIYLLIKEKTVHHVELSVRVSVSQCVTVVDSPQMSLFEVQ